MQMPGSLLPPKPAMYKFYMTNNGRLQTDGHEMKLLHLVCITSTKHHMHYALRITLSCCISEYWTQISITEDVLTLSSKSDCCVDGDHHARMHAHQVHVTVSVQNTVMI
jgi:hypothetical protein